MHLIGIKRGDGVGGQKTLSDSPGGQCELRRAATRRPANRSLCGTEELTWSMLVFSFQTVYPPHACSVAGRANYHVAACRLQVVFIKKTESVLETESVCGFNCIGLG